jgi:hypothetical protein
MKTPLAILLMLVCGAAGAQTPPAAASSVLLRGWSGSVSASAGLSSIAAGGPDASSGAAAPRSDTVAATFRYNPRSFWYARATFIAYVEPSRRQPWNPDFTYGFGYDDWHPGTVSLTYENFGGNCLRCTNGSPVTRFQEGSLNLGWKMPVSGAPFSASLGLHVNPRYFDLASNNRRSSKSSATADLRWAVHGRWYVSGRASFYPVPGQKQPWDPDFTYGFGYFDWRPGTFSVEYSNYAANRYPTSRLTGRKGTFQDGSVSVTWTWTAGGKP